MEEKVTIQVMLGVGMNQLFPETITIEIEPEVESESSDN